MTDEKIHSVRKLEDGRYEMKTISGKTETIVIAPEDIVKETHKGLKNSVKRIEDNISKLVQEEKTYKEAEDKFSSLYTDEDVKRFNEIAQLADARNNIGDKRGQIEAARNMIDDANAKIRKIEAVITELKR